MALINFSPNPNDCSCDITGSGGGALEGNESHNLTYTLEKWRYDDTPMPHWEPDGSVSESVNIRTKSGVHFDRWGAIMTGNLDQQPLDGHLFFTSVYLVKGWTGSEIKSIQFDGNVWDIPNATGQTTTTNAQGESTITTFSPLGYRFNQSSIGWNNIKAALTVNPDCLVFASESDLDDYLRTGDSSKAINTPIPEPTTQTDYDYYMYNQITSTVGAGLNYEYYYRYTMNPNERLALYLKEDGSPYDRVLKGVSGIAQIYKGDSYTEEVFPMASSTQTQFLGLRKKLDSGTTWTPIMYETNIPTFDTEAHADAYILSGDETGIIDKWRTDDVVPGEIGDPTDTTEQGENGAVFSYGGGMFRLSNAQLASFYTEAFNTDPNVMQSILDGLKLFGSNQINCIHDVMYIPFSAEDVATLSSGNDIFLGSYKMTTVQGDKVLKNDKLINMGTHYFAPPYGAGDHRNYAPLCRIFVMLPYAGTHELQIDKYIGKNITIKLAVDLTTGAGTYFIYSNQTIMDSFDCQIGAHRPITAVDHAQHVSAVTNAILQTGTQGIKTVAGATHAINPARGRRSTSINVAGVGGEVKGALDTVLNGYQAMQSIIDYPMTERGSFNGFLGMFDVKSPYFVFCQMKTKQAQNLIAIKGKPSAAGGKLSSFSGYFEAAAVDLPTFSGTEAEAEELMSILKGGIYID